MSWVSKLVYLRYRILIIVAASFSIAFISFAIILLRHQRDIYDENLLFNVTSVSQTILKSLEQDMMTNDTSGISRTLEAIGQQDVIAEIRIFNHQGQVRASMTPKDVGITRFDNSTAVQCSVCHASIGEYDKAEDLYTYKPGKADDGLLGAIIPIRNQPRCASAACHPHEGSQEILGFLELEVRRKNLQDSIDTSRKYVLAISALFLLVFPIGIMIFIRKYVTRPLKQLVDSTKKVSRGDFELDLPLHSSDEIGELAKSFNEMVGRIQRFQEELETLNRNLEIRVASETGKLKVAQQQIVQAEKMSSIGRLAAVIAHEINNPIAGLVTFTRLLLKQLDKKVFDDIEKAKMKERLALMESEAVRCGGIVSELLTFTREAKKMMECRLEEIIRRSASIVDLKARDNNSQITLDIGENLPSLLCDPGKIQQVLMVLLHNAIEAMPMGGETQIKARAVEDNVIELRVSDDGIGIPKEHLPHVFEPFYSSKDQGQSVGIGLFVAYGVIDQHHGTIEVISEPGNGTEVIVRLPGVGTPSSTERENP